MRHWVRNLLDWKVLLGTGEKGHLCRVCSFQLLARTGTYVQHIKRKCMGIEPTGRGISPRPNGFEDRGRHQPCSHFPQVKCLDALYCTVPVVPENLPGPKNAGTDSFHKRVAFLRSVLVGQIDRCQVSESENRAEFENGRAKRESCGGG